MKSHYHRIVVIICWFLVLLGLLGCGRTVKMERIPELRGGSPLSEIPSMTFGLRDFEDARPIVAVVVPTIKGDETLLDPGPTQIVTRAIEKELTRNGHKVLRSGDFATADVVITGSVTQFVLSIAPDPWRAVVESRIQVTSQTLNGTTIKTYRAIELAKNEPLVDIMSRAVSTLVKEFTMDPEFLERLKSIKKAR